MFLWQVMSQEVLLSFAKWLLSFFHLVIGFLFIFRKYLTSFTCQNLYCCTNAQLHKYIEASSSMFFCRINMFMIFKFLFKKVVVHEGKISNIMVKVYLLVVNFAFLLVYTCDIMYLHDTWHVVRDEHSSKYSAP